MRLRLAVAGAIGAVMILASVTARAADPLDSILTYGCDPPLPRSAANCDIWHTVPVNLRWTIVDPNFVPVGSGCNTTTMSTDTTGAKVTCTVQSNSTQVSRTVTLYVDQTPPTLTGTTTDRPPDHDGWWNHPLAVAFSGTDATSGIAGCDTVGYAGPDSATAQVTGGCRDVAGNAAGTTISLKYDATPPDITALPFTVGDKRVTVNWVTSPDVVATSVVRSPGIGGAPASQVYSGSVPSFTDTGVVNRKQYTYTITIADPAGNLASAVVAATPKAPLQRPLLRWKRKKGADYYNVQVFRGRRKILSAWPRGHRLRLHLSWKYHGHQYTLTPGRRYDWYAWPGFGRRSAHRYGKLITHRHFTLR